MHLVALTPARQLLTRRRPERVACRQQHRLIDLVQMARQLADRRRLAGPVHPGDHHHQRIGPVHVDGLLQRRQKLRQDVDQRRLQRRRIVDPVALGPLAQLIQQPRRRTIARVTGQQRRLQLLVQRLVNPVAAEDAAQLRARARQTPAQPREPASPRRPHRLRHRLRGRHDLALAIDRGLAGSRYTCTLGHRCLRRWGHRLWCGRLHGWRRCLHHRLGRYLGCHGLDRGSGFLRGNRFLQSRGCLDRRALRPWRFGDLGRRHMRHIRRRRLGPRRRQGAQRGFRQGSRAFSRGGSLRCDGGLHGRGAARNACFTGLSGLRQGQGSTLRLQHFGGLCAARRLPAFGRLPGRLSSSLFSGRKVGRSGLGCGCIFLLFLLATEKTEHVVRPV